MFRYLLFFFMLLQVSCIEKATFVNVPQDGATDTASGDGTIAPEDTTNPDTPAADTTPDTLQDTAMDSAQDVPIDTPLDTLTDTSLDTPADIPEDVPVDTPLDAPADTLEDVPVGTPQDTPQDTCQPDCTEKSCGEDGCGGSCGTCPDGYGCTVDGECLGNCGDLCEGRECGTAGLEDECFCGACDDENDCTEDSCDDEGQCVYDAAAMNTEGCDDGDACTEDDHCQDGLCSGSQKDCADQNPCTDDGCFQGQCTHVYNSDPCDDEDPCTLNDTCDDQNGQCAGTAMVCDDGNSCTQDSCVEGECLYDPDPENGYGCEDGNPCTGNDICVAGECIGTVLSPDELLYLECICQADQDCELFDDGNVCNGTLVCVKDAPEDPTGICEVDPDTPLTCDDEATCTEDTCDPVDGCIYPPITDGCDDGNQCTDDSCDPATGDEVTGCINAPAENYTSCDAGEPCTPDDYCIDGVCTQGVPIDCDDGKVCTNDYCNADTGECVHDDLSGGDCEDGDLCTLGDTCQDGVCTSGLYMDCNDENPCTWDSCNSGTGFCEYDSLPNGHDCGDGLVCQDGECTCVPESCEDLGKDCGTHSDGCSGFVLCGPCTGQDTCQDGQCICQPLTCDTEGWECGMNDDGCGGTVNCGSSCNDGPNDVCSNGACVCTPDCTSRACGNDGCGGSCGTCNQDAAGCGGTYSCTCDEGYGVCIPEGWVLVEGDTFDMGPNDDDNCKGSDNTPQHPVTITRPMIVSDHEVTLEEWGLFSGNGQPPGDQWGCATSTCPLVYINWYETLRLANQASTFFGLNSCYTLSNCMGTYGAGCPGQDECTGYSCSFSFAGLDCNGVRLLTEAEWEYLAKAGTGKAFGYPAPNGTDKNSACNCCPQEEMLTPYGWYCNNSGGVPHQVRGLAPNAFDLYDMAGNVWEMVWDEFENDYYSSSPDTDPLGPSMDNLRVKRGGNFDACPFAQTSYVRYFAFHDRRTAEEGTRLVRSVVNDCVWDCKGKPTGSDDDCGGTCP